MKRNVDHGKFALGAYGSTLLSGTAGLDLSGSSAKVYITMASGACVVYFAPKGI